MVRRNKKHKFQKHDGHFMLLFIGAFLIYYFIFGHFFKRDTIVYDDTKFVINPSKEYVISILQKTDGVIDIKPVTRSTDINNILSEGGSAAVFFTLEDVDQSQFEEETPIDKGTDGGGCIEVYPTKDDAESRIFELKLLSLLAGYSKGVGTVIVRISAKLTREQQEGIANRICEKLVSNNGQIECFSKTVKTSAGRPIWFYIIGCIFSAALVFLFSIRKTIIGKIDVKKTQELMDCSLDEFKIPFFSAPKKEIASRLITDYETNLRLANRFHSIRLFIDYYDSALIDLQKLMRLDGKVKLGCDNPTYTYARLKDDFQWHLRDAIERDKDKAIKDIKIKYRNSQEHREQTVRTFEYEIEASKDRFSDETTKFANAALLEVKSAAETSTCTGVSSFSQLSAYSKDLRDVDRMDGHDFEYWCADLLKKNGFSDVSVTKGSGDQGVDIIAKKDGIKYAIQCKCYSSDLGNTPVQEVHAGKAFYGCQVGAVMTNRNFTSGAQELAEKTGVLLWNREKLLEYLNNAQ